ncbi:MAG: P44/Msp2 family outer membrane protein [Rhodothalassiaceae bacterium]|nr:MAG: P44/Msp2 family outer membrane protein [Rhodothalassiaceae bacterium]
MRAAVAFCALAVAAGGWIAASGSAAAQGRFYVSAFGGVSLQNNQVSTEVPVTDPANATQFKVTFDPGFVAGGGIGYAFADQGYGRFRVELEVSYRESSVDKGLLNGNPVPFQGDDSSLAGLAMLYYDVTGISARFIPYVGAGVGIAGVESDARFELFGSGVLGLGGPTDTELAWQAVAGFAVPINRHVAFTLDGRYYATTNPSWTTDLATTGSGRFESEFTSWHVTAGFRISF